MKLIAYLRVSSDAQMDGYGLTVQENAIRGWAEHLGHELIGLVEDVGVSGATDALDRPGLGLVLQALRRGDAEGLVVARLDRLARALTVQEATLAVVWRMGHDVYAADSGQVLQDDPDDPMRTALRQVVGIFSELDRRMVVKRLRDGRASKAADGRKSVGSYAYGFQGGGLGRERDAVPNPAEQEAVRLILEARADGASYRQIVRLLDAAGLAPRRASAWSPMTIRSVVQRAVVAQDGGTPQADDA
jgi:DNA invertase Pin-like site-specific DNA recombinase